MQSTRRLPPWLKIRPPTTSTRQKFETIKQTLRTIGLTTVCEEAHCPNLAECWSGGTATFMLMGDTCTRGCRFCAVKTGNPKKWLDPTEPQRLAEAIEKFGLDYVVITSVARDDLPDGGARHIANCLNAVHKKTPKVLIEVLIPDFRGKKDALEIVLAAKPTVLAHNIETTERLTPYVRDGRAKYRQSLELLKNAKKIARTKAATITVKSIISNSATITTATKAIASNIANSTTTTVSRLYTKSSLMLGLGETEEELIQTFKDLREYEVDMLTLGQYLQPSPAHVSVKQYIEPSQFDHLAAIAKSHGFLYVASGPFVRSSYRAGELFIQSLVKMSSIS